MHFSSCWFDKATNKVNVYAGWVIGNNDKVFFYLAGTNHIKCSGHWKYWPLKINRRQQIVDRKAENQQCLYWPLILLSDHISNITKFLLSCAALKWYKPQALSLMLPRHLTTVISRQHHNHLYSSKTLIFEYLIPVTYLPATEYNVGFNKS